jgi:beta-glucosidase
MTGLTRADFGDSFTWGVAHASYQVEGAWNLDGKSPSVWDTFTTRKGKIRDGSDGRVACDFYHRYDDDTAIVADLGFAAQRFSISWPRILPGGTGRVNPKGIDFYSRVVDACLDRGVEPWVTLYHWDLPQVLQDRGGWANRDSIGWFSDYTTAVVDALGDRVKHWMVFNEPCSFLLGGYLSGIHAPGVRSYDKFLAATHHVNLAQAASAAALRAARPDLQVGTTHIITPFTPAGDRPRDHKAAAALDAFSNRIYLEPNFGLGYPTDAAPIMKRIERHIRPGDDTAIRVDWDFIGVQYYQRLVARPAPIPGLGAIPWPRKDFRTHDITAMGWEIQPDGLYEALQKVHAYDPDLRLLVTENGTAVPDKLEDGRVRDVRRTAFYRDHLVEVRRAKRDGVPVDGYFCWSLMDNFEWAEGYVPRFGLVHVDYDTQVRTVKDSGRWFQDLLAGADMD